jgi:hypothetical protein
LNEHDFDASQTNPRWPMKVSASRNRLRQTTARDYALRFVFGGLITVAAGLVTTHFGPVAGGLLLAFPAILPASLTLLAAHAHNTPPAGADAYGSIFGSVGLVIFSAVVWTLGAIVPAWLVLSLAVFVWIVTACGTWVVVERLRCARRERANAAATRLRRA